MTSTQTEHPGSRGDRIAAGIARWENNNPGAYFAGVTYDDRTGDVFIDHVPGGNTHRYSLDALRRFGLIATYRVDAEDIDPLFGAQASLVDRLRAHGLSAVSDGNGGATLTLDAIAANALADALDRLEAQS